MEIAVADNPERDRYEARVDGESAGYVAYRRRGERIALNHPEVDDAYEGKGVGSALASYALDDARARGLAVIPYCPFINEWLKRHPSYTDLVPADERERFGL